jgi:TusA-related sulfurtransferase
MSEINGTPADAFVDITDVVCPMTFVKAKVAIEALDDGQTLDILLNDGEPIQNIPRSLKDEGHRVVGVARKGEAWIVRAVKGGLS